MFCLATTAQFSYNPSSDSARLIWEIAHFHIWKIYVSKKILIPEREGDIGLFIKLVSKVLWLRFLIRWINNFGGCYWILVDWFINFSVQTFQPLIVIYIRGNFMYHHWKCKSIYRPLSYPFRFLNNSPPPP